MWRHLRFEAPLRTKEPRPETEDISPTPKHNPKYDWVCSGVSNGFRCGLCKVALLCIGGKAYMQPCPPNTSCSQHPEFADAVCHTIIPSECQCRGLNELLPDPYNPSSFIVCTSMEKSFRTIEMCPDGYLFSNTSSTCQKVPVFPPCTTIGTFSYLRDCQWYYSCTIDTSGHWIQIPAKCPRSGHVHSMSLKRCADPNILLSNDPCSANSKVTKINYVCTFLSYMITTIFPSFIEKFCQKI